MAGKLPTGLTTDDIALLGSRYGKNEFSAVKPPGPLRKAWDVVKEPMFLVLVIACLLYFIVGEIKEGLMMATAMIFVTAISFYQDIKSTHALAALQQYTQPMIRVIRDGREQSILSAGLVPGDIMLLEEGDLIPADAIILRSNDCSINESVVTGESVPVDKSASAGANLLFQGSTVNAGNCLARVTAIGNDTVLGKLGKSLESLTPPKTRLQEQIQRFVRIMALIGMLFFCLIWLVNYLHTREFVESLLLGLTLAMSIIPEEIPVAFSSFMALGAFRMTKLGIITRQPLTIENLGAVSIICLDKTGTITENRMEVRQVYDFDKDMIDTLQPGLASGSPEVLRYARLASEVQPFDAMEKAIVAAYQLAWPHETQPPAMIHEYPLSGQPPMMTHVYKAGEASLITAKGAPERIISVCRLDPHTAQKIQAIITQMAGEGLRVLGISASHWPPGNYPAQQDDFDWEFKGLVALYDPPRKEVKKEFAKWYAAGIKIKLVTGDFRETAENIAARVGLVNKGQSLTGQQVMQLAPSALNQAVEATNIFVRMFPEAKLKLIEALKANGETVAMMGDGVNDGPALRAAHIGIAMGGRGTEIARQAAALVLTDDNLEKVTEAIAQGRKIFYNLKKAVRYIVSIHVPIILIASVPVLLGWKYPNIFTPIHVIFLELIMGPTCSVFFENEPMESGMMLQPPRTRTNAMFNRQELLTSVLQGLIIASGILGLYHHFMETGASLPYVRAMVFITLTISNILLTLADRSFSETILKTVRYKNFLTKYVMFISLIFLSCILFIPFIRGLFNLAQLQLPDLLRCFSVAAVVTLWFELYKWIAAKRTTAARLELRSKELQY